MNMRSFFAAVLAQAALATGAVIDAISSGVSVHSSLPAGSTLGVITWTMPIVAGGENYTFIGTAEEVFAQINQTRVQLGYDPLGDPLSDSLGTRGSVVDPRTLANTICKVGLQWAAQSGPITIGIGYLSKLVGDCGMNGDKTCGRISCSWESAIYWCNDNPGYFSYSCSGFAQYAQDILNLCQDKTENLVWGQAFDTEEFQRNGGLG